MNKIYTGKEKPLLLFSALDWGLGHVTRSISLLREFQEKGWEIIVACNSSQKGIFSAEIDGLKFVNLSGAKINYAATGWLTRFSLALSAPKNLIQIKKETSWVRDFLAENRVDLLISDNRYGFRHPSIQSVFITHQLYVITGFGRIIDRLLQRVLYRHINKFNECWVPDEEINGLAGRLSHPLINPAIPVKYIGYLSRLDICETANPLPWGGLSPEAKGGGFIYDYCILLSGPEPQRTILEKKIIKEFSGRNKRVILIRGLPDVSELLNADSISIINYASSIELNRLICSSEYIICRSGYSSIMDLIKLKKKMILIPTPGQAEQEYLADYLSANKYAVSIRQDEVSFKTILNCLL
ncbi:MAG: glycosyl transferase family 28 [Chitinophagaceae bacterium]|nr:glycosyl transferase family 28 [Chitinophagaceae bacterium]